MWSESKLYQNLEKIYGEEESIKECERLLGKNRTIETIYEIEEGNIVKNYDIIKFFGFNSDKYIENVINSELYEDDKQILNIIEKKSDTHVKAAMYMSKHTKIGWVGNEDYTFDENMTLYWSFDKKMEIVIPNEIKNLVFCDEYNQETVLPNNIESVEFGFYYNNKIDIPNSIKTIRFGVFYDQKTVFPNSINTIIFGRYYDQQTILPDSVETVVFGNFYNKNTILPNNIKTLIFGQCYNQYTILPNNIETLQFGKEYKHDTIIPNSVNTLILGRSDYINTKIPESVKRLHFLECFGCEMFIKNECEYRDFFRKYKIGDKFPIYIPNTIEDLTFGDVYHNNNIILVTSNNIKSLNFGKYYNGEIVLQNGITDLTFGDYYNRKIFLPSGIINLKFGNSYNQKTILPNGIINLTFGNRYNQKTILPNSIVNLKFGNSYNKPTIIPNSVKCVEFGKYYNHVTYVPQNVEKCYLRYKKITIGQNTEIFKFDNDNSNFEQIFDESDDEFSLLDDNYNDIFYDDYDDVKEPGVMIIKYDYKYV